MSREIKKEGPAVEPEDSSGVCDDFGKFDKADKACINCEVSAPKYVQACMEKSGVPIEDTESGGIKSEENEDCIGASLELIHIDPKKIKIQKGWNLRKNFINQEALINSIVENGIRNPITVKQAGKNFLLIDGERRIRAVKKVNSTKIADIKTVPAFIEEDNISDIDALFISLVANDGERLEPIEEAHAFKILKDSGCGLKEIAKKTGSSIGHIDQRLLLLDGTEYTQEAVKKKKVPASLVSKIVRKSKTKGEEEELIKKAEKKDGRKEVRKEIEKSVQERKVKREGITNVEIRLSEIFKACIKVCLCPILRKSEKAEVLKLLKEGQKIIKEI